MKKATKQDIEMLEYFWDRCEDIERYIYYSEIESDLKENYPLIFNAWNSYKSSKTVFETILKKSINDIQH